MRQQWRVMWILAPFWGIATAAVARAHHPTPQAHAGAEGAWPLLWLLGAGVFMGLFQFGSLPHALARRNLELFAQTVLPALRRGA